MATYDMTSKATVGVDSDSIAAATSRHQAMGMYMREARLDIAKMVEDGYSCADGDIFQLLEIPANTLVLFAGAEVETAFNGTSLFGSRYKRSIYGCKYWSSRYVYCTRNNYRHN